MLVRPNVCGDDDEQLAFSDDVRGDIEPAAPRPNADLPRVFVLARDGGHKDLSALSKTGEGVCFLVGIHIAPTI